MYWDEILMYVMIGLGAAILSVVSVYGIAIEINARHCLAAGWPKTVVDYNFTAYCVKLENNATVVRRVEDVR